MNPLTALMWVGLAFQAPGTTGASLIQYVNAGGPAVVDAASRAYLADDAARPLATGGEVWTMPAPAGAALSPVYLTQRWGTSFSYRAPVSAGSLYWVRLRFIEPTVAAAGMRIFSVTINGSRVLPALDLFAVAGYQKPYDATFIVDAPGPEMLIEFAALRRNAIVAAIELANVANILQLPMLSSASAFTLDCSNPNGMRQAVYPIRFACTDEARNVLASMAVGDASPPKAVFGIVVGR